jgi:hypothetical protein
MRHRAIASAHGVQDAVKVDGLPAAFSFNVKDAWGRRTWFTLERINPRIDQPLGVGRNLVKRATDQALRRSIKRRSRRLRGCTHNTRGVKE